MTKLRIENTDLYMIKLTKDELELIANTIEYVRDRCAKIHKWDESVTYGDLLAKLNGSTFVI